MPLSPPALLVKQLSKTFNGKFRAVEDLSFSVKEGSFTALLGENGAGKTTTISMIVDLLSADQGSIEIFGHDTYSEGFHAKMLVGYVAQENTLHYFQTVEEMMFIAAGYMGIPRKVSRSRVDMLLKMLGLAAFRKFRGFMLSGGMKKRLEVALALVHKPKLLLLDEPTTGVDVNIKQDIWKFICDLNTQEGLSIILTTHQLEEVERYCKHVVFLHKGRKIQDISLSSLMSKYRESSVVILDLVHPVTPEQIEKIQNIKCIYVDSYSIRVFLKSKNHIGDVIIDLSKQGIHVTRIRSEISRMESIFTDCIRKASEEDLMRRTRENENNHQGIVKDA